MLPDVPHTGVGFLPADANEKNVLTCYVRNADDKYNEFLEHSGTIYIMERVPEVNLVGIKYLLPMVGGKIDGYYDIERMAFKKNKNEGAYGLCLRLGKYHNIGNKWVHIYRTKMQPGEVISLDFTMTLYKE